MPLTDPAINFERTRAVLAGGARAGLDAPTSKMLRYMLWDKLGCDAWLTRKGLTIQYGWHLAHHRYYSDDAPGIASYLLEQAGVRGAFEHGGLLLPGDNVRAYDPFPVWAYRARAVWIETRDDQIDILVREGSEAPAARPAPLEPPVEYIAGVHPCPHCHVVPERYRKLSESSLVCLACGASHTT